MRKIKKLEVKKAWAAQARRAMRELQAPFTQREGYVAGTHFGYATGCCSALYNSYLLKDAFKAFINPSRYAQGKGWWWHRYYNANSKKAEEGYTARIIALESFALYCEEHGV